MLTVRAAQVRSLTVLFCAFLGACGGSGGSAPSVPPISILNMRSTDLPADLQQCNIRGELELSTPQDVASARKLGALEFSAVNYSNDASYCSTGKTTQQVVLFAQALLVRFRDRQSALKAYQAHLFGVGTVIGDAPYSIAGSATGFGPNSVRMADSTQFLVNWQKGEYLFKGADFNLSNDQSVRAMMAVYSRVPS